MYTCRVSLSIIYLQEAYAKLPTDHLHLLTVFTVIYLLQIDFSALIDVRVLTNGGSKPGTKAVTLPGSSGEPTSEPSPGMMFSAIQRSANNQTYNS